MKRIFYLLIVLWLLAGGICGVRYQIADRTPKDKISRAEAETMVRDAREEVRSELMKEMEEKGSAYTVPESGQKGSDSLAGSGQEDGGNQGEGLSEGADASGEPDDAAKDSGEEGTAEVSGDRTQGDPESGSDAGDTVADSGLEGDTTQESDIGGNQAGGSGSAGASPGEGEGEPAEMPDDGSGTGGSGSVIEKSELAGGGGNTQSSDTEAGGTLQNGGKDDKENLSNDANDSGRKYYRATVNGASNLRLRSGASQLSSELGSISEGTSGYVIEKGDSWTLLAIDGQVGYMSTRYLILDEIGQEEYPEELLSLTRSDVGALVNID